MSVELKKDKLNKCPLSRRKISWRDVPLTMFELNTEHTVGSIWGITETEKIFLILDKSDQQACNRLAIPLRDRVYSGIVERPKDKTFYLFRKCDWCSLRSHKPIVPLLEGKICFFTLPFPLFYLLHVQTIWSFGYSWPAFLLNSFTW